MSKVNVCDILNHDDRAYLNELAILGDFSSTNNLWPDQLELMFQRVGLKVKDLDSYRSTISALIGIRNDIAHGKEIRIKGIEDYEKYEYGALSVCLGVILEVQKTIEEKNYRKQQPIAAAGN